jgi:hypothetical protein
MTKQHKKNATTHEDGIDERTEEAFYVYVS